MESELERVATVVHDTELFCNPDILLKENRIHIKIEIIIFINRYLNYPGLSTKLLCPTRANYGSLSKIA